MAQAYNKKFFLKTGYKITETYLKKYSQEINEHLQWSFNLSEKRKVSRADIAKLERLIENYPEIMAFRNHLVACHNSNGDTKIAEEMTFQLLNKFPDYDFAKFDAVQIAIKKKDYETANKILGESRKAEDFFKNEIIHISAFINFQVLAAELDIKENKLQEAEKRLDWVEILEPAKSGDLIFYRTKIMMKRMEQSLVRLGQPNPAPLRSFQQSYSNRPINQL